MNRPSRDEDDFSDAREIVPTPNGKPSTFPIDLPKTDYATDEEIEVAIDEKRMAN